MKKVMTVLAALLVAVVAMGQTPAKVYGVKSGAITTIMNMMGQDVENTTYFDDYGAKQASEMEMMGMKMTTIMRDGKTYMVNAAEKQVQEMPGRDNINYLNLTPEVIKKYNVKEVGKETVAGKECTKYTAEIEQMGQKAKVAVSVWKGIAMKSTVDMGEFAITQTVKEVKECPVDAKLFEIPKF